MPGIITMYTCLHPALKVHTPKLRGHSTDRQTGRCWSYIWSDNSIGAPTRDGSYAASEERRALGFCTGRVANHFEGAAWKVGNPALTFHYNNQPGQLLTISLARLLLFIFFLYSGCTTSEKELLHLSVLYKSHSSMLETWFIDVKSSSLTHPF